MGKVVKYEPCPECRRNGRDNRGDNLVCYHDGGKHCFSCGYHEYSRAMDIFRGTRIKENVAKSLLPTDFTREVPASAWRWLLQYGLPYSYWQKDIGYSPSEERLVFRVGEATTSHLQFSIGRYVGTGEQTGNHTTRRKWYVWGDSHRHAEVIGDGNRVVLVEDIVSAHKVGQVTTAIPLFGVNIHNPVLYYLLNDSRPVIMWLDKDQEGAVNKKVTNLQAVINRPVSVVFTDKDPKELNYDEIKHQISN